MGLSRSKSAPNQSSLKPLSLQPRFGINTFANSQPTASSSRSSTPPARPKVKVEPVPARAKGKAKAEPEDEAEVAAPSGDGFDQLWVERYSPHTRDELGVHPNKVKDVAGWLDEAYNPKLAKYRRLLVLSGPAGAGKTATLRVLAQENEIDILEYRNSHNLQFASLDRGESTVAQFTSFLSRAGMAPALDLGPDPDAPPPDLSSTSTSQPSSSQTLASSSIRKRLILLEDLPNVSHFPTKLALRSALMQFLKSPRVTCPLVLIVSEALARPGVGPEAESVGGDGAGRGESVDARAVCGMEVLGAVGCRQIQFNAVAPTILTKALTRTVARAYAPGGSYPDATPPNAETLKIIAAHSNGDLRSALMSLEFLASEPGGAATVTSLAPAPSKKRKANGSAAGGSRKEQVQKLLQFVTARESSLFLFHALGKVLYNKRWGVSAEDDKKDRERAQIRQETAEGRLPRHLRDQYTRNPSKVDPDVLFAEAPIDSDVFTSYVHHNFTPFTNDIDECLGIIEGISTADALMRMEGEEWLRRAPLTSQYSFHVAVRSTLVHLPSPVPKRKQTLRKSALWDNLRNTKANEDTIAEWSTAAGGVSGGQELVMLPRWEDGTGGGMRSRRAVVSEMVPWVGTIGKRLEGSSTATHAFLANLAAFPPVPGGDFTPAVGGESLEEYAVEVEDDAEGAVGDEGPVGGSKRLEEVEEVAEEDENEEGLGAQPAEELLYDPDDDIVDDDD